MQGYARRVLAALSEALLAVPVRIKIAGIMILPVVILGLALNYWVRTGLSDWLSYLLSNDRVQVAMESGGRSVLMVTVLAAMISILLTYLLMVILTQPLLELRQASMRVSQGQLDSRARVWARDEIGEVAQSINAMIDHLVASQASLQRTNRRLQAISQVALAASVERSIHDMLHRSLQALTGLVGACAAWVHLYDPEREKFHLASWHQVPEAFQGALLREGKLAGCACREALLAGDLQAGARVFACSRLNGGGQALRHLSLGIQTGERPYGVLNLLLEEEQMPSADDMDLLNTLTSQLSEIVANAWLQLKLEEKENARQDLMAALIRAQEDERGRLSRELHDGAGQVLTSLLVRLKALERGTDERMRRELEDLCDQLAETIEYVRHLSHGLRPFLLDEVGLQAALQDLVKEMAEGAGLRYQFNCDLRGRSIPPEIESSLYRVSQELLTNVVRHAQASRVGYDLRQDGGRLFLRVTDDGRGFRTQEVIRRGHGGRMGLANIRERVEVLGGEMAVNSQPGAGTEVELSLPLPAEEGG